MTDKTDKTCLLPGRAEQIEAVLMDRSQLPEAQQQRLVQQVQATTSLHLLHKQRQAEKAIHFMERRSDQAASLPSEIQRHLGQFRQQKSELSTPAEWAEFREEYKYFRQDLRQCRPDTRQQRN